MRRHYPRYALEAQVEIDAPSGRLGGTTRNLSRGGFCAELDAALEPGTEATARISLIFDGAGASEPIAVPVRVVWCTAMSGAHQVGVKFSALDSEQRSYLEMFLRFLEEAPERGAV